ncbi:rhomboid family intramembrane serine protease [Malikia sp.]|uniref:rhomboid family intramembrane serine protease n=1 Tax=Malikia sp. TaxID=2070706 RepID=UPI00262DD914|nr:rhomboid family intramembrane serine protease [Malikia sp.]
MRQRLRAMVPLAAALLLLALQLWPGGAAALRFERTRFVQGAWWEPVSSQFVHLNLSHALANAAALLLIAWLLRSLLGSARQSGLLAGALAGVALRLVIDVDCAYYAGFSGALHGWLGGALAVLREPAGRFAPWRWGLLGLLLLKVGLELAGRLPTAWNFPVYYPSHAAGLAGGLCAAGFMRLAGRTRASLEAHQQRG